MLAFHRRAQLFRAWRNRQAMATLGQLTLADAGRRICSGCRLPQVADRQAADRQAEISPEEQEEEEEVTLEFPREAAFPAVERMEEVVLQELMVEPLLRRRLLRSLDLLAARRLPTAAVQARAAWRRS